MHKLASQRNFAWLDNFATGGETWIVYMKHTRKRQWLGRGERGTPTQNPELHLQKVFGGTEKDPSPGAVTNKHSYY